MVGLNLFLVFLLIGASAFFVMAEFSFLRVRSSRIEQLISEGNKKAIELQKITFQLDGYLSACQLGITVTSLALGFLGEPTVARLLEPLFEKTDVPEALSHSISIAIAFLVITYFHVVLGELAPKTIAIQKAEKLALLLAKPMRTFYVLMYPFIWVLNGSGNAFARLFGVKPSSEHEEVHSEEELKILLSESYENGEINQSEYRYVNRIFNFDELAAREIMIPRIDLVVLDIDAPIEENIEIMKQENYTRFPVVQGDKDHIVGFIHSKEFFMRKSEDQNIEIKDLIRPMVSVPDGLAVKELLRKMQSEAFHFAVVTDEYGGTSGLVTLEDILEEIVGEIRDEFDEEEKPEMERINESEYIFDNKFLINEVNTLLGTHLSNEDADTIGGLVYIEDQELEVNDELKIANLLITILEKEDNRYKRLKVEKLSEETNDSEEPENDE